MSLLKAVPSTRVASSSFVATVGRRSAIARRSTLLSTWSRALGTASSSSFLSSSSASPLRNNSPLHRSSGHRTFATASSPSAHVAELKDEAGFDRLVMDASEKHPVLVDCYANWCGPCKQLTPRLEAAVNAHNGKITLVKVNIDEFNTIAERLMVTSIPAVFAFHKREAVNSFVGALPAEQLNSFIKHVINDAK
ncbi:Thioredoxin [Balamuthia mandrillaris]